MRAANLCILCKGGRNLCGNSPCPLLRRMDMTPRLERAMSTEFFGPSPNIFVGRHGYPRVNVGPMGAMEASPILDSPGQWLGRPYQEIVEMRSLLLRSKSPVDIHSRSKIVSESQEIAMASRPADVEITFKKKPVYRVSFSDVNQPMGPSAPMERMRITENTRISAHVERLVNDEVKASEAGSLLYRKGEDVYKITTILSSGALGLSENKRMVPTRWSITATDDMLAKHLLDRVRSAPEVNDYLVFEGQNLDNHFVTLMMPGQWQFENFEAWAPGSVWSQSLKRPEVIEEYEPFRGRTTYADRQGGGYYASRIAAIEKLAGMRRQASVIVFREIYDGYVVPLGVWVVRETARSAYRNRPRRFSTKGDALSYVSTRLRLPLDDYRKKSRMLRQSSLKDFLAKTGFK